jgi:hypothetical protein
MKRIRINKKIFDGKKVLFITGEGEGKKKKLLGKLAGIFPGVVQIFHNPENDLSPKRQAAWWDTAKDAERYIVSTNSPHVILACPHQARILRILSENERNEDYGEMVDFSVVDVSRLTPNSILTSPIFFLERIFSPLLEGYDRLDSEDDFDDILCRQRLEEKINRLTYVPRVPPGWLKDMEEKEQ